MSDRGPVWSRRAFVGGLTVSGVAGVVGGRARHAAAEPPPETTRIRLPRYPFDVACVAPQWAAEDLLKAEGFTDVQYIETAAAAVDMGAGKVDVIVSDGIHLMLRLDAGDPSVVLAGVHSGCYELFGRDQVRTIKDLKGRSVGVANAGRRAFVATMASYVGLDVQRDLAFVMPSDAKLIPAMHLFLEGKVDAFLGFPPEPQELRARKIGHVVVDTGRDRPWSQYFCCLVAGNREFVRRHPIAAKRALRALLKATDLCAADPERVGRLMIDRGFIKRSDYAVQVLKEVAYNRWREYSAADTIRFYALRMHEAGVIKSNPHTLITQGTDLRFLNELKKELKG